MKFVDILLELINKKGITKNKMLTDLHLSKNSFVDWTGRGTIPSGETLSKIAAYFNVSTDYLLGNEQKNSPSSIENELSEREKFLIDRLRTLTPEQQDMIYRAAGVERNK